MKNVLKISALAVTLTALCGASANAGALYIAGRGALFTPRASDTNNVYTSDLDTAGYGFGGAVGLHNNLLLVDVRMEAEYFYRSNISGQWTDGGTPVKMDSRVHTGMGNLYLDLNLPIVVFPNLYVMGGIGFAVLQTELDQASRTNTNFAWNVGAGISRKLPLTGIHFDLGYRYADLGKAGKSNVVPYSLKTHELVGGLRFRF